MYRDIIDYIRFLYPEDCFIPLHNAKFIGNEKRYLEECVDSTFVSSIGTYVNLFEKMVADYTGSVAAVACCNGTSALHIALIMAGVKPGDEVITQPLTFVATANAITYCGATPVFVDVDRDTMGLSPNAMEQWLTTNAEMRNNESYDKNNGKRIKAAVPMHTFGHPVRLEELLKVCEKWNVELIEDAAESLGSFYDNKHTGTFGKIGILSFNGNKTITTGGGGMILFQDKEMGDLAKHITTQAKIPHKWEFIHDRIGYNYRMPNINAAIGCAQMEMLDTYISDKRNTANLYSSFFKNRSDIIFISEPDKCRSNYWLNTLIFESAKAKNVFLEETNNNGVMTRPAWQLMPRLSMFKECPTGNIENAEWLADRAVNIPSSIRL